jgi:hypothetical protein
VSIGHRTPERPGILPIPADGSDAHGRMRGVSLQRAAWLVTVLGFLAGGVVLLAGGYQGYAAISAACALAAAVNLW